MHSIWCRYYGNKIFTELNEWMNNWMTDPMTDWLTEQTNARQSDSMLSLQIITIVYLLALGKSLKEDFDEGELYTYKKTHHYTVPNCIYFPNIVATCTKFSIFAPREGTPDFKWCGWSKDFFGFEIFNSGIFLGRKIWQVFFWGWLDLNTDFFGYRVIQQGIFWWLFFVPGIFFGIVGRFWVLIFASIRSSL